MARIGVTNLVEKNLDFWLNDIFLDAGLYENIELDETNFSSGNLSILQPVNEDGVVQTEGTTAFWKSQTPNWVYESGIVVPSGFNEPIVASGVYISSVFKTKGDVTYAHAIDYFNGQVVFDTELPVSTDVKAEFSYKTVLVKFPDEKDEVFLGRIFTLNPEIEETTEVLFGSIRPTPIVLIEWSRTNTKGLQMGSSARIVDLKVMFHIMAQREDDYILKDVMDTIMEEEGTVPVMVNWNLLEDPLDYNGDFASGQEPFSFKAKQADNNVFFHKLYLESMDPQLVVNNISVRQAIISTNARVYLKEL